MELAELLQIDSDEDSDSELSDLLSEDEVNESDLGSASKEQFMILSKNKSPQDQMKFIISEESIVERFGVCSICINNLICLFNWDLREHSSMLQIWRRHTQLYMVYWSIM
jgi:hypothetical protein